MLVYLAPEKDPYWETLKQVAKDWEGAKQGKESQQAYATLFWWCADRGIRLANDDQYIKATYYFQRASLCYEGAQTFQKELDLELAVRRERFWHFWN